MRVKIFVFSICSVIQCKSDSCLVTSNQSDQVSTVDGKVNGRSVTPVRDDSMAFTGWGSLLSCVLHLLFLGQYFENFSG